MSEILPTLTHSRTHSESQLLDQIMVKELLYFHLLDRYARMDEGDIEKMVIPF